MTGDWNGTSGHLAIGGGWDTGSGTLTTIDSHTGAWWSVTPYTPTYTYHSHTCWHPSPAAHEHDYRQAEGDEHRHLLFCRSCGETKALKARGKRKGALT